MKVYVRAPYSDDCLKELETLFDQVVYEPWTVTGERFYEDEMLENLLRVQPDALITELDRVTEKVLSGYDKLKFIGDCRGTPANLQVDACTKAGVPILCTPGRNTQAVAEMVVGLLLTVMRKTIPAVQWVKDGKWVPGTTPYYLWMGNELQGKKVGFVGSAPSATPWPRSWTALSARSASTIPSCPATRATTARPPWRRSSLKATS